MSFDYDRDMVAQREGASARPADELASLFIYEAGIITASDEVRGDHYDSHNDPRIDEELHRAMDDADEHGWCEDVDNAQMLHDEIMRAEGWLAEAGMTVVWDDGYVIYRTEEWTEEDWEEVCGG